MSSPPENVESCRSSCTSRTRARGASTVSSRARHSLQRAPAELAPLRTAPWSLARVHPPPWQSRAGATPPRGRSGRARPTARTRGATGRGPGAAADRAGPPASPCRRQSSRVVAGLAGEHPQERRLAAPFGPERASGSRRSTLNETSSKRSPPESSFRSWVPIDGHGRQIRLVAGGLDDLDSVGDEPSRGTAMCVSVDARTPRAIVRRPGVRHVADGELASARALAGARPAPRAPRRRGHPRASGPRP